MRRTTAGLPAAWTILFLLAVAGVAIAGGALTTTEVNCSTGAIHGVGNCEPLQCKSAILVTVDCGGGAQQVCFGEGKQEGVEVKCEADLGPGCCVSFTLYCCDFPEETVTICCP